MSEIIEFESMHGRVFLYDATDIYQVQPHAYVCVDARSGTHRDVDVRQSAGIRGVDDVVTPAFARFVDPNGKAADADPEALEWLIDFMATRYNVTRREP